jgi:hypothetical protein
MNICVSTTSHYAYGMYGYIGATLLHTKIKFAQQL